MCMIRNEIHVKHFILQIFIDRISQKDTKTKIKFFCIISKYYTLISKHTPMGYVCMHDVNCGSVRKTYMGLH